MWEWNCVHEIYKTVTFILPCWDPAPQSLWTLEPPPLRRKNVSKSSGGVNNSPDEPSMASWVPEKLSDLERVDSCHDLSRYAHKVIEVDPVASVRIRIANAIIVARRALLPVLWWAWAGAGREVVTCKELLSWCHAPCSFHPTASSCDCGLFCLDEKTRGVSS